MPNYICIKACIWHKPDFATPRHLEPDGGKTVYVLKEGAPPHIFRRIDEPEPRVVQGSGAASLGELPMGMRNPRAMFLELASKDRSELEKIAEAVELPDVARFPDNIGLVKAILKHAGYIESSASEQRDAGPKTGRPSPTNAVDLVQGSPEAERALAGEGQPLREPGSDPEEREMDRLLQERANEPKPEPTRPPEVNQGPTEVELLNKSRKQLNEIAKGCGVPEPEKAANKPELVAAILKAAGYQVPGAQPGA